MFATSRTNNSNEPELAADPLPTSTIPATQNITGAPIPSTPTPDDASCLAWHLLGEYTGPVESVLPRDFRQRLHKQFARIEREFEREYRRLYGENLALQERLEKFEEGDHPETTPLVKKLGASMLSQRIKQQYKQSTSRLVSTLRQSAGHSNVGTPNPNLSQISTSSVTAAPCLNTSLTYATATATCAGSVTNQNPAVFAGSFPGHGGSWQLMNRVTAHRDGIWEVTCFRKLLATASADSTVKLWSNDTQLNCLMIYTGHSGSVNSVRFRNRDNLMLTSSGDGTAHLIRLPVDLLMKVFSTTNPNSSTSSALEAAATALNADVAGTGGNIGIGMSGSAIHKSLGTSHSVDTEDTGNSTTDCMEEGSPVRLSTISPITVQHPHAIFQSANLYVSNSGGPSAVGSGCNFIDSSPLSAADFVSGRDQLVTASWDRLGRMYDLATGQELESLSGHDLQLTDIRCALAGAPVVVSSSRDCTFRLWDFRQPRMCVHVQQAHSQTVSTTQFLNASSPERLISAGVDRFCRIWDLRQSRGPLVTIRTDARINRLAISGCSMSLKNPNIGDTTTETTPVNIAPSCTTPVGEGPTVNTTLLTSPNTNIPVTSTNNNLLWNTSHSKIIALPFDNRGIKFFDLTGNRIGRVTRSSTHGHSRMVTSVAWADEGVCNFFSAGFDCKLLTWQIHLCNT